MEQRQYPESKDTEHLLKSLGFPQLRVHRSFSHFDFRKPSRRILVIGPMGSGKTEFSARLWRDARVAMAKSEIVAGSTRTLEADRRKVFYVRSKLDAGRFPDYPVDALAYRGGFERCGDDIAWVRDSFELEALLNSRPDAGTWVIDEAAFYDERVAYLIRQDSERTGRVFVLPTLILNFRRELFNPTASLLVETATDVFPLTAYCDHPDCIEDSFYTYRYYRVDGVECPALYFDPLIIAGGDREKDDPREPNYCTRCDRHHYLPGKAFVFLVLKPLGEMAARGNSSELEEELGLMARDIKKSRLYRFFSERYANSDGTAMNALRVPCIAEKALIYLFAERNLLTANFVLRVAEKLDLDIEYLTRRLSDNGRSIK